MRVDVSLDTTIPASEGAKEIVKLLALLTIPVSLVATARARLRVSVEQASAPGGS
jgi:hypothetical protein